MTTIITYLDNHPRICAAGAATMLLLAAALQDLPISG